METRICRDTGLIVREDGAIFEEINGEQVRKHTRVNAYGYEEFQYHGKFYRVHRIVANAFLENPENKPTVDHINHDRLDNRACNLRHATWKEQAENRKNVLDFKEKYGGNSKDIAIRHQVYLDKRDDILERAKTRRDSKKEELRTWQREYRKRMKDQGFAYRRCPDGKRRWVKVS